MTDQIAGELIAAYNRGFNDGYECGLKDWHLYEQDMKKMNDYWEAHEQDWEELILARQEGYWDD